MRRVHLRADQTDRGFTIVELVIALPIISTVALALISLVTTMFFQIMANNSRLGMLLEAQTILLSLQDEMLFTTNYDANIRSDLSDPYEPSGGWTAYTAPETLIIYETALTAPRRDPDREFVYKNSCSQIAYDNIIYFTVPNTDNNFYSLYRRVLTPQYTTYVYDGGCQTGSNYRSQTCPTAFVGVGSCGNPDALISDRVKDFYMEYYDEDNNLIDTGSGGDPADAELTTVNLLLGDRLFGQDVEAESSLTMRKIN